MYLFDVSSRHMAWLSERQAVTAANIANADTPGYRTRSVSAFSDYLEGPPLALAATSAAHISLLPQESRQPDIAAGPSWASSHSGNNVSLEVELMAASSTNRMMNTDAAIIRSFHPMFLSSVKV